MVRGVRFLLGGLLLLGAMAPLPSAEPPGKSEWKLDVVHRKVGASLRGLVVEQTPMTVRVRCVSRKPGSPTVLYTVVVPRVEIASLQLLSREDRERLERRLDALKRERELLSGHLSALDPANKSADRSDDFLDLRPVAWPGDPRVKALGYDSTYFRLIANTRPELAQLAAIQLEQIYAAYARALPHRMMAGTPTTILLTRSLADYQKLAKLRGLNLFNPAFYDPAENQVVCGSDLDRMCSELREVRTEHEKLRASIRERRAELHKIYKGKAPAALLTPLAEAEARIVPTEDRNAAKLARVSERLFRRLYHESFHAYLNTFVYPARGGAVPIWLNEGLAQIFETAIVEVGELRVGHADETRLKAVRKALLERKLLPLVELLRSEPRQFQVAHAGEQPESDRHYLAAWGLTFYLTFEKRLMGTKALDDYVAALSRGVDPLAAFRDLVGMPLEKFEAEYLQYLGKLRPNGTTMG